MKKLIATVLAVSTIFCGLNVTSFAETPISLSEATRKVTPQHNEETTEQELARYFKEIKEKCDQIKSKHEKKMFINRELETIKTEIEYYNKLKKTSDDAAKKEDYLKKIISLEAKEKFLDGILNQLGVTWQQVAPWLGSFIGVLALNMLLLFTNNLPLGFLPSVLITGLLEQTISACL